jgi:hypothetical protein
MISEWCVRFQYHSLNTLIAFRETKGIKITTIDLKLHCIRTIIYTTGVPEKHLLIAEIKSQNYF